jgi:hypothetical protein
MNFPADSTRTFRRRKPIAAGITALFAIAAPETFAATTWVVKNCTDAQPDSLRAIVASSAVSGDTVDLSKLGTAYSCPGNTIALTSGALTLQQSTITLSGPPGGITITGYYNGGYQNDRLIKHTGTGGTLYLQHVDLEYSKFSPAAGDAKGGCIYSAGNVNLSAVTVFHCQATATAAGKHAFGGGIYAVGNLKVKYSLVSGNTVAAIGAAFAPGGGGVYVNGNLTASYSTISANSAPNGNFGRQRVLAIVCLRPDFFRRIPIGRQKAPRTRPLASQFTTMGCGRSGAKTPPLVFTRNAFVYKADLSTLPATVGWAEHREAQQPLQVELQRWVSPALNLPYRA